MNKRERNFLKPVYLIIVLSITFQGQAQRGYKIRWEREKIAPGIVWKHSHSAVTDSLLQNINILIVNTGKREISLLHDPLQNKTVSSHVSGTDAIAAVNAGFFNIKEGGSVTYLKTEGIITDQDTAKKWKRTANMNGAVLIDRHGKVFIDTARSNGWYDSHPEYEDVLVTGCLLLKSGKFVKMPETSLVINRHPRTCVGTKGKHKVILATVDGRTDQAAGMTLPVLAGFMLKLKCTDAVNLDGGGSTTMWIRNEPFEGVVNMPSDNKKFDHEGARAVANVLMVR